jgi:hypothetical protein
MTAGPKEEATSVGYRFYGYRRLYCVWVESRGKIEKESRKAVRSFVVIRAKPLDWNRHKWIVILLFSLRHQKAQLVT